MGISEGTMEEAHIPLLDSTGLLCQFFRRQFGLQFLIGPMVSLMVVSIHLISPICHQQITHRTERTTKRL
jgi:hypothetical protein